MDELLKRVNDLEISYSGLTEEFLCKRSEYVAPLKEAITEISSALDDLSLEKVAEVDYFTDEEAGAEGTIQIIFHSKKGLSWDDKMDSWDKASALLDKAIPARDLRKRIVISIE